MAISDTFLDSDTTFNIGSGNLVLTWAASEVDSGDIIVLFSTLDDPMGSGTTFSVSGFTQQYNDEYETDAWLRIWAKVSDGSETGATIAATDSAKMCGGARVVKSTTETLALTDISMDAGGNGSGASTTAGAHTPDEDVAQCYGVLSVTNPGTWDNTPSDSFVEAINLIETGGIGDDPGLYVAGKGITGGGSQSMTDGWSNSDAFGDIMFAVNEPAAGGTTVTPAVIATTTAMPASTPQGQASVTPAAIAVDYALAASTPQGQAAVAPAAVAAPYAMGAATPTGAALASPSVFDAPYALPAATALGQSLVLPGVIAAPYSVGAVTITIGKTVFPAVILAPYAVDASTPQGAALATPTVVLAPYAVGQATPIVTGGDVTVTPVVILSPYALDAATPTAPFTATPPVITAGYTLDAVSVSGAGRTTPGLIVAPYSLAAASVTAASLIAPALIVADYLIPLVAGVGVLTVTIFAPEAARLYRLPGASPRLNVGMGPKRGLVLGLDAGEGWEIVSEQFKMNGTEAGILAVNVAVASAWSANSGASAATLKAAIDSALQTVGFRKLNGGDIT